MDNNRCLCKKGERISKAEKQVPQPNSPPERSGGVSEGGDLRIEVPEVHFDLLKKLSGFVTVRTRKETNSRFSLEHRETASETFIIVDAVVLQFGYHGQRKDPRLD